MEEPRGKPRQLWEDREEGLGDYGRTESKKTSGFWEL